MIETGFKSSFTDPCAANVFKEDDEFGIFPFGGSARMPLKIQDIDCAGGSKVRDFHLMKHRFDIEDMGRHATYHRLLRSP